MPSGPHRGAETREHEVEVVVPDPHDNGYPPISDYAVVGDAQSVALINSRAGVDWLCLPRVDSPAVLCRILDANKGGFLVIHPRLPITKVTRRYRPDTTILETTLHTAGGRLRITDCMPASAVNEAPLFDAERSAGRHHRLIRLVEALDEPLAVTLRAKISFDFARVDARIDLVPGRGARFRSSDDQLIGLSWPGNLETTGENELAGELRLSPGAPVACVLDWVDDVSDLESIPRDEDWSSQVSKTAADWKAWTGELTIQGRYNQALRRSALTLKLLTFAPTGAIVAAPTTSLPEVIGGSRNWDYRYCWLRDATFTLYALLQVGDEASADAFWGWVERTCADVAPSDLHVMYPVHGDADLTEHSLDHLSGYRDSAPVRTGNGAWDQKQIDVYGELIDAFWFYHYWAREHDWNIQVRPDVWNLIRRIADYICQIWREKDRGLWEVRGDPRHFVYSKVMCWVGLDRAIQFAANHDPGLDVAHWCEERDAIRNEVLDRGWNAKVNAFTMAYDSDDLDAATLRMPLVGFLPADDPRMEATIDTVRTKLGEDGLIMRYRAGDGLSGGEGAFAICSFWMVECLAELGRLDDAQELYEHMLGYASDLGLFAEEIDPKTGTALGNYPQAFTHLALINAGIDLTAALQHRKAVSGGMQERASAIMSDWRAAQE